jgi:hypothetical protein
MNRLPDARLDARHYINGHWEIDVTTGLSGGREVGQALIEHPLVDALTANSLMKEGGVIACEAPRHPFPAIHPASRSLLIEPARRLDAMVLRWAR